MGKHEPANEADNGLHQPPKARVATSSLGAAPEAAGLPAHAAAPPSERLEAQTLQTQHIPRFLVRPHGAEGGSDLDVAGSYRFPSRPTPVLRAAITLMGLDRVERASRPRATSYAYRCAHVGPAGERLGPTATSPGAQGRSKRWPNV